MTLLGSKFFYKYFAHGDKHSQTHKCRNAKVIATLVSLGKL